MVMNDMCILTQFVVYINLANQTALYLVKKIMKRIVLKFGMVDVVVVNADSKYLKNNKALWYVFGITFHALVGLSGNHKGLHVELFHWFMNKTQKMCDNDCGTHKNFVSITKTLQYPWKVHQSIILISFVVWPLQDTISNFP